MEYVKIMIAVVWLISLANLLDVGIRVTQVTKKTYVPKDGSYYKAVGFLNIVVGMVVTLVVTFFFADSWVGPEWMITAVQVGGIINMIVGLISAAFGVMKG